MKLVTYLQNGQEAVGLLNAAGDGVLPLPFSDMTTLIESTSPDKLGTLAGTAEAAKNAIPLSSITLLSPIP